MALANIAEIAAAAWQDAIETTERPDDGVLFRWFTGERGPTYREHLDRIQINWHGKPIPRIAVVKRNLMRLGKPRVKPRLPD